MSTSTQYYSEIRQAEEEEKRQLRAKHVNVARERARLLSLETNKRRRNLETRRQNEERKEEERRETILSERREWQKQATIHFQRAHLPPDQRDNRAAIKYRAHTPPRHITVEDALRNIHKSHQQQQDQLQRCSSVPPSRRHRYYYTIEPRASPSMRPPSPGTTRPCSPGTTRPTSPGATRPISPRSHSAHRGHHHPHKQFVYGNQYESFRRPTSPRHIRTQSSGKRARSPSESSLDLSSQHLHYDQSSYLVVARGVGGRVITTGNDATKLQHEIVAPHNAAKTYFTSTFAPQELHSPHQNSDYHIPNTKKSIAPTASSTSAPTDTKTVVTQSHTPNQITQPSANKCGSAPRFFDNFAVSHHPTLVSREESSRISQQMATDSRTLFEKQLEGQQQQLIEMQKNTLEDFQKALHSPNTSAIISEGQSAMEPAAGDLDNEDTIMKDSLEVNESNGDLDSSYSTLSQGNQLPNEVYKRDVNAMSLIKENYHSFRPKNPEPQSPYESGTDDESQLTRSDDNISDPKSKQNLTPTSIAPKTGVQSNQEQKDQIQPESAKTSATPASVVSPLVTVTTPTSSRPQSSKFTQRTPQSTATVTPEQAQSIKQNVSPATPGTQHAVGPIIQPSTTLTKTQVTSPAVAHPETIVSPNHNSKTQNVLIKPLGMNTPSMSTGLHDQLVKQQQPQQQQQQPVVNVNTSTRPFSYAQAQHYSPGGIWGRPVSPKPVAEVAPVSLRPLQQQHSQINTNIKTESEQSNYLAQNQQLEMNCQYTTSDSTQTTKQAPQLTTCKYEAADVAPNKVIQQPTQQMSTVGYVIDPSWSIYGQQKAGSVTCYSKAPGIPQKVIQSAGILQQQVHHYESQENSGAQIKDLSSTSMQNEKSHKVKIEIRSSSPFEKLVDTNPDDIEAIETDDESFAQHRGNLMNANVKSILKRSQSADSRVCPKDSMELNNTFTSRESSAGRKRSVRFAQEMVEFEPEIGLPIDSNTCQNPEVNGRSVQNKMPPVPVKSIQPRPASAKFSERIIMGEEVGMKQRNKPPTAPRPGSGRGSARPVLKQADKEHGVHTLNGNQTESVYNPHQVTAYGVDECDFNVMNTPTDEEINVLWESIRQSLATNPRIMQQAAAMMSGVQSASRPSNVSNSSQHQQQYTCITRPNSAVITPHYIDGASVFGQIQPGGRASSALPARKQPLLQQRQKQNAVGRFTPSKSNVVQTTNLPYSSLAKTPTPSQQGPVPASKSNTINQADGGAVPITESLAAFLAAEDFSQLSMTEEEMEERLKQLTSRNITQLSLEEQRVIASLEKLNNMLKYTEGTQQHTVQQNASSPAMIAAGGVYRPPVQQQVMPPPPQPTGQQQTYTTKFTKQIAQSNR